MNRTKVQMICICVLLALSFSLAWAQRKFVNESGDPIEILTLRDSKGIPFAQLFMSGKEMIVDNTGTPVSGPGFYKALPNNYHYVPFMRGGFGGLHVDKIEWDDSGKTISIERLEPVFESEKNIKISSDVSKPKLIDGVLHLKLEGYGKTDFQFRFSYGKGVSINPPLSK